MKWTTLNPKPGDTFWERKFALFPKKIPEEKSTSIVWLEFYYIRTDYLPPFMAFIEYSISRSTYTKDHPEVQKYLLTKTPLGKALKED